jgi:hypothetical protein
MASFLESEIAKWAAVIRAGNIRPDLTTSAQRRGRA